MGIPKKGLAKRIGIPKKGLLKKDRTPLKNPKKGLAKRIGRESLRKDLGACLFVSKGVFE